MAKITPLIAKSTTTATTDSATATATTTATATATTVDHVPFRLKTAAAVHGN